MSKRSVSSASRPKHVYERSAPLESFLFMGCWNKNGCAEADSAMVAVSRAIRREDAALPLVLAGDNVYPYKKDGHKIYSVKKLHDGIACLKPEERSGGIFTALGNHNIADPAILEAEFLDERWFLPNPFYAVLFPNKAALLFLDSNLIEADDTLDMLVWLRKTLKYLHSLHIESYYLIMHHPIISFKKKSIYTLPHADQLLEVLGDAHALPVAVLVADTHNYQKGVISVGGREILQVVSGTGGADLDGLDSMYASNGIATVAGVGGSATYTVLDAEVGFGYQHVGPRGIKWVPVRSNVSSPKAKSMKKTRRGAARRRRRGHYGGGANNNNTRVYFNPMMPRKVVERREIVPVRTIASNNGSRSPVFATRANRPNNRRYTQKNIKRYSYNMNNVQSANMHMPEGRRASVSSVESMEGLRAQPFNFAHQMQGNRMHAYA